MKKYLLHYWYLATGMEGVPQEFPEAEITAEDEDHAYYEYFNKNGIDFGTFEEYMKRSEVHRRWATTCKEVKE
jgi:hypothetical protein